MFMVSSQVRAPQLKVYQYQIELEGGLRFGPTWMHKKEVEQYIAKYKKNNPMDRRLDKYTIRQFWVIEPTNKFRNTKPEVVKK